MERFKIHPSESAVYFCTFSVVEWLPVFISETACQVICQSLRYCHKEKFLAVDSFVIMPTHLHLIVFDREFQTERLEPTLLAFRKFTGRELVAHCKKALPACFESTLANAARGNRDTFGQTECGVGDARTTRGVGDLRTTEKDRDHRFWQPSRHPESLRSQKFLEQKRGYLHDNPRRKGLVRDGADWRWSSANFYITDKPCDVPITPMAF